MKNMLIVLLCLLLAGLGLCVFRSKSNVENDPYWAVVQTVQSNIEHYSYAFYDVDSNGINEFLLGYDDQRPIRVYTILSGVAAEIVQLTADFDGFGANIFFENGTIKRSSADEFATYYSYYRLEAGELAFQGGLIDENGTNPEDGSLVKAYYRHYPDGTVETITKEEFDRVKAEFEGDGQEVELDWKPLKEYRRR